MFFYFERRARCAEYCGEGTFWALRKITSRWVANEFYANIYFRTEHSLFLRIRPDVEQKLPGVVVTIARANGADPFGLLGIRSLAAQWVLFLSR